MVANLRRVAPTFQDNTWNSIFFLDSVEDYWAFVKKATKHRRFVQIFECFESFAQFVRKFSRFLRHVAALCVFFVIVIFFLDSVSSFRARRVA